MWGGGEGPAVTDSSMQSTSPQGRNQEAEPLTQAGERACGSAEQCQLWPYEESFGGDISSGQAGLL